LKVTRTKRAEERAMTNALRAQIGGRGDAGRGSGRCCEGSRGRSAGVAGIEVGTDRLTPCSSLGLHCGGFLLSDPLAGEGCSERAWVPGEVPVP
jgi:hypothetical protein